MRIRDMKAINASLRQKTPAEQIAAMGRHLAETEGSIFLKAMSLNGHDVTEATAIDYDGRIKIHQPLPSVTLYMLDSVVIVIIDKIRNTRTLNTKLVPNYYVKGKPYVPK